jgi:hypothetical protein
MPDAADAAREIGAAAGHRIYGKRQFFARIFLQHIAADAACERAADQLGLVAHREDDHSGAQALLQHPPAGFHAI